MEGLPTMKQSDQGQPNYLNLLPPIIASNSQNRVIRYQTPTIKWPGDAMFGMVVPIAFPGASSYPTTSTRGPYFLFELRDRGNVDNYAYGYTRWYSSSTGNARAYAKSASGSGVSSSTNFSSNFFPTGSGDKTMFVCAIFDQKYASAGNLRISSGIFPVESSSELSTFIANYKRNPAEAISRAWNANSNKLAGNGSAGVNQWAASSYWNPSAGSELYIDFRLLNVNDLNYSVKNPTGFEIGAPIAGAWIG